jgi:hypothetical protein
LGRRTKCTLVEPKAYTYGADPEEEYTEADGQDEEDIQWRWKGGSEASLVHCVGENLWGLMSRFIRPSRALLKILSVTLRFCGGPTGGATVKSRRHGECQNVITMIQILTIHVTQ